LGESFPDISVLIEITRVFNVSIDELINAGEPTEGEAEILERITAGKDEIPSGNINDILNLAPYLKPSILDKMAGGLMKQGIDISNIVALAEFMSDSSVIKLLENATFDSLNENLIEKLIPFLDEKSKNTIFEKILDGELDWHLIKTMFPYFDYMISQIEEAVVEGALPEEMLKIMFDERFKS
jgi:hypothetical protein